MSFMAERREQRRHDQWMAAHIRQVDKDAAARRRHDDRTHDEQRKHQRRDRRRAARAEWVRRLPEYGRAALWATMIVLPISLAWQAQALFALNTLHIAAPFNHGFPASIELAAWLCAFEAHLRRRRGESAGLMPTYMWSLAGVAAVINASHGLAEAGVPAALGLATTSMLGIVLHSARQGLDAGKASGTAHVRLALWRRFRYPRLSLAATSLRAARDGLTVEQAWTLAWRDRFGVGPNAPRRDRRLGRLAVKRAAREDRQAVRDGDVTVVDGRVQRGFARTVREMVDRQHQETVAEAVAIQQGAFEALTAAGLLFGPDAFGPGFGPDQTTANPPLEQGGKAISPRTTQLLPVLREAILEGKVPPDPKVKVIERWVRNDLREGIGTPDAMELRDRVKGLRPEPAEPPAINGKTVAVGGV